MVPQVIYFNTTWVVGHVEMTSIGNLRSHTQYPELTWLFVGETQNLVPRGSKRDVLPPTVDMFARGDDTTSLGNIDKVVGERQMRKVGKAKEVAY